MTAGYRFGTRPCRPYPVWGILAAVNCHIRVAGRFNQRYAILFRDYLRAHAAAAAAYGEVKRSLAARAPHDWDLYYDVKDPAIDMLMSGAEEWAQRTDWSPGPSDA